MIVDVQNPINGYSGLYSHKGNQKLGKQVSVINREAGATCPGETKFCRGCYAKKGVFAMYSIQKKYAAGTIQMPKQLRAICRLHASGDFDTVGYVRDVVKMVREHPDTLFWTYTHSWRIKRLLPDLEILRAEPNVQLFASVDKYTPNAPKGWRVAFIRGDDRYTGMECLEQNGKMPDCQACTYCFRKPAGNVQFNFH